MNSVFTDNYTDSNPGKLRKIRILVAPLDWGLGHATRCIPIIRSLLDHECEVLLAGEGAQEIILKNEFPALRFLPLRGYRIRYGKSATRTFWKLLFQTPSIRRTARYEHQWLKSIVQSHSIDMVISDNRFGLHHPSIPSVFITHQLSIKSPMGKWSENILQRMNYSYINRFHSCWVPDVAGPLNFAGALSHPANTPLIPLHYIGPLSRFTSVAGEIPGHLLFILSGPEPQRSIFENIIINEIAHYPGSATVVRGVPAAAKMIPSTNSIRFYNHLPSPDLNAEAARAEFIISRSGYSTIMDIAAWKKKSMLVPTPGQTEQEYLGHHLQKEKWALVCKQGNFKVNDAVALARQFEYKCMPEATDDSLKKLVEQMLAAFIK